MPRRYWIAILGLAPCFAQGQASSAHPAQEPDLINPDRPGIADGSNVVGKGHFQIEIGAQWERHDDPSGKDRRWFVPTLLRLGLSDKLELRSETGGAYAQQQLDDGTTTGYQPVSIGAKFHFQEGKGIHHPSVGTILRVFPASGSGAFASTKTQADIRLVADWDVVPGGSISLNPNIGIGVYESDSGGTFTTGIAALTVTFSPTSHFSYFVDGGLQAPEAPGGKNATIVDFGTALIVGSDTQFDLSFGTGVSGESVPHPFWSAGISRRY